VKDPVPTSQNCRFLGECEPVSQTEHPPGEGLAVRLRAHLSEAGLDVRELDNWRDVGWSMPIHVGSSELLIALSQIDAGEWMLQVAPLRVPGFVGRLLGRCASAGMDDVLAVSQAVQQALCAGGGLSEFRWCWDEIPNGSASTTQPIGPSGTGGGQVPPRTTSS